jgi:hypothetical protein
VAERVEKALKYYGGNNSPVVVIKVVITHRLVKHECLAERF